MLIDHPLVTSVMFVLMSNANALYTYLYQNHLCVAFWQTRCYVAAFQLGITRLFTNNFSI